ncbi:MAG: AAA family ATPase [Bryobacterales bacterium]|nr:AAA family ATPase [Bryobacterales bacterium]
MTQTASPSLPAASRAARAFADAFRTGRSLVYVRTPEEERVGRILAETGGALLGSPVPVWSWSLTRGLWRAGAAAEAGTGTAESVLEFIAAHEGPGIFQLRDFHEPMRESAAVRRWLRDLYELCRDRGKYIVVTSPVRAVPAELDRAVLYMELRPPDLTEIVSFLRDETRDLPSPPDDALLRTLAPALQGLTLDETRYALRRALAARGALSEASWQDLLEEKRMLVNRGGVLEFISTPTTMDIIGGLENLKRWLLERRKLFDMRESLSQEIVPKGLLMMGIPGCGKSLCVKAISSHFQLPLYRMDMVEVFSGRYGSPEVAFADACKMMEDLAPAVLWFDEIEMAVTSTESSGEQGRIFAFFLTWMQEKTPGLFVAATANRIDLLPAEMIRKGRFDEVFFVDLPTEEERMEIFRIHLARRGYDPETLNIPQLMEFTQGWTGAEIEQCVIGAITRAKLEDVPVKAQDLLTLAAKQVPLSRTMKEQINHIRAWAFERAIKATPPKGYAK